MDKVTEINVNEVYHWLTIVDSNTKEEIAMVPFYCQDDLNVFKEFLKVMKDNSQEQNHEFLQGMRCITPRKD